MKTHKDLIIALNRLENEVNELAKLVREII